MVTFYAESAVVVFLSVVCFRLVLVQSFYCLIRSLYICTPVLPTVKSKVKVSHTRYRALGPELIPVYRQSARR